MNQRKKLFALVGGVPASGKTTHCVWYGESMRMQVLSAGVIISTALGENTGLRYVRPLVEDGSVAERNQQLLIEELKAYEDVDIVLDSHFVIPTLSEGFVPVPMQVFEQLAPTSLHLVRATPELISERLLARQDIPRWWDGELDSIKRLAELEHEHASRVSGRLNLPLQIWPNDD